MAGDSHAILSGFIETAPDAMILVRADGTIVEANRRADALFGLEGSLVGHVVEELLPAAIGERHRGHRQRYMTDPSPRPMGTGLELRARRVDGSEFDVDVSLGLLEVEGEQLVSAALRDVTDRVEAQRALAASAYIVDHSHDAIYSLDGDGVVATWNHTAELLTGRDGTEVIGRRIEHPLGLVDPVEEEQLIDRVRRGELIHRHRTQLRRADGLVVPVDLSISAIRDDRGRIVGISGIARDVTEEITTQETLAEIQSRLTETQRLARIGLWLHDVDSGEVQWSKVLYDLTGISPLDFGGDLDSFLGIVADEEHDRVAKEFATAIADGTPIHIEFPVVHADGSRRWFMCRAEGQADDDGRIRSLQGICQDLTERQRLLEALQEADRLKDEFLATVSHELRTPLTSIVGFSQILRDHISGEHARWLDVVIRNGEEMNSMVERILDFSRLQSGRLGLGAEEVTGNEVVELVRPLVENALADHELVVDVDPRAVVVVDPNALKRILVNLLTNAAKFSEPGSPIRLEVAADEDEICFRVVDQGIGIPPEHADDIFQRFHQVAGNPQAAKRGVGVGLSIVKGYAEALGGTVSVTSEVGVGSTFEVRLPRRQP